MAETPESTAVGSGRNPRHTSNGASRATAGSGIADRPEQRLLEAVVESQNVQASYRRVMRDAGAPGIDGMRVDQLEPHLDEHWQNIKEALLQERYLPQPVDRIEILEPNGGVRQSAISTVVDRLIQHALHRRLSPLFEPGFSESSYGFRPRRSAHQAALKAREYVAGGKRWVVDLDLKNRFGRVNHDVVMALVGRTVKDSRVVRLTRRYLQAGIMRDGPVSPCSEGSGQGPPSSRRLEQVT